MNSFLRQSSSFLSEFKVFLENKCFASESNVSKGSAIVLQENASFFQGKAICLAVLQVNAVVLPDNLKCFRNTNV